MMLRTLLAFCSILLMHTANIHADVKVPVTAQVEASEQTLSLIKPDAVKKNHVGDILARFEKAGLRIAALRMVTLTPEQAGKFYAAHKEQPFYPALVEFMASGPIVAVVLEGNNAVKINRELMGATDPSKAAVATIRKDFASSVRENAVHGSDSQDSAKNEIPFFFQPNEIMNRFAK